MRKRFLEFVKAEAVLCAAAVLAAVSAFFVLPDREYLSYIDFRTLALLLCLMIAMAGLRKSGVFNFFAEKLLQRVHGMRSLIFVPVMLCFFFSMLITNDVALITFVPFSFTVLDKLDPEHRGRVIVPLTLMQTVAANLGSMLTPIGNPQNLYLQGISGMGIAEFMLLMLPYTIISFLLLCLCILFGRAGGGINIKLGDSPKLKDKKRIAVYAAMFALCILTVARVLDYRLTLAAVLILAAVSDYKILLEADYCLLLTFIAFFVFIGNMGRVRVLSEYIRTMITNRECLTAVLSSQLISNVPAALLLSGFTSSIKPLIIGVNLGGLGTLIASMASLISYKYISREYRQLCGKYMLCFTAVNIIFLAVLFAAYILLS